MCRSLGVVESNIGLCVYLSIRVNGSDDEVNGFMVPQCIFPLGERKHLKPAAALMDFPT